MPKREHFLIALAASALAAPLLAAGSGGGGGMGGGAMPSDSAPRYDPAEEYRKGVAALQAKDFKAAKVAFDRVLTVAPKEANTNYMAGLARSGLADWKGSRRFYEKAIKLDDGLIGAHRELGVAHAMLAERPKAEATLAALQAKATTCASSCPQAGELKTAIDAVTAALSAAPQAKFDTNASLMFASSAAGDGAYLAAVGLINEKRYDEAIASLKAAQQAFGPHPDILTYLGFANRKLKNFEVAEGYYHDALAVAPDHRGATEYFGELMVERGDMAGAKAMLAKLDAECRFGCAEAEELRGWINAGRSPHS